MSTVAAWFAVDPVLPHRDTLLDDVAMRERFSRLLARSAPLAPLTIDACDRARVTYDVGKSLRVLYRLRVNGSRLFVASRMFKRGRSAAYAAAVNASEPVVAGLRPVTHDPSLESVYWAFPNDRKIKTLPLLLAPPADLSRVVPGGWTASEIAAYAPEKTATAACLNAGGEVTAFVKVAAGEQSERDGSYYDAVRATLSVTDAYLVVPAPLGCSAPHRMLWLEAVTGRRAGDGGDDATSDDRALGAAVARFHACTVAHAPAFTRFDPDRLATAARILTSVRPDLGGLVTALVARLYDRAVPPGPAVCLHGDLHPKNALVCGSRIALLDLEDLASGPAACDIGSYLGALEYTDVTESLPAGTAAARGVAFLEGYGAVAPLPDKRAIGWHVAASIFVERAVRSVTRIRPRGLNQLPAVLDRAMGIATRGLDD